MTNLNVPQIDLPAYMREIGERARVASRILAAASTAAKNAALVASATALRRDADKLLAANHHDVTAARSAGEDSAFIDRLTLKAATVSAMAEGLEQIASLSDPVG